MLYTRHVLFVYIMHKVYRYFYFFQLSGIAFSQNTREYQWEPFFVTHSKCTLKTISIPLTNAKLAQITFHKKDFHENSRVYKGRNTEKLGVKTYIWIIVGLSCAKISRQGRTPKNKVCIKFKQVIIRQPEQQKVFVCILFFKIITKKTKQKTNY